MPSRYHRILKGPDLSAAFEVQSGLVGIETLEGLSLALPAGSLWPGFDALPQNLINSLQPSGSVQIPGTVVVRTVLTPREIRSVLAGLQAARLSRGLIITRLNVLAELHPLDQINQSVTACLIGVTREAVSKILNADRRRSADR